MGEVMSLELLIYLAGFTEKLGCLFFFSGVLLLVGFSLTLIAKSEDVFKTFRLTIACLVLSFLSFLAVVLLPSEKTIYSIAAIKMGKEISKNEKVIETSDKIYKLLNQKLDEVLKEK